MSEPVINFTEEPSGKCPVQAEGTINGHEFYFRSRGKQWSVYVAPPGGTPFSQSAWWHHEDYPGADYEEPTNHHGRIVYFSAGWAEPEECRQFITKAAKLWLEAQTK